MKRGKRRVPNESLFQQTPLPQNTTAIFLLFSIRCCFQELPPFISSLTLSLFLFTANKATKRGTVVVRMGVVKDGRVGCWVL